MCIPDAYLMHKEIKRPTPPFFPSKIKVPIMVEEKRYGIPIPHFHNGESLIRNML